MSIRKQTFRTGPYKDIFAQVVKVDNVLYLAGQVGVDTGGAPGTDITEQTKLAYANIAQVLSEFGATMNNIADETMFVTDVGDVMKNDESEKTSSAADTLYRIRS